MVEEGFNRKTPGPGQGNGASACKLARAGGPPQWRPACLPGGPASGRSRAPPPGAGDVGAQSPGFSPAVTIAVPIGPK